MAVDFECLRDPLAFCKLVWPDCTLYKQQREICYSVRDNDRTFVPAGNALGKDFVSAFIAIWWFCTRIPARVVTTSVKQAQLEDVLWGEIRRFIQSSRVKLPLLYNHLKIRRVMDDGSIHPNSELVGQVSNTQEGLLGRHSTAGFKAVQNDVKRTLVIFDEASSIDDETYRGVQTWADSILGIGNTWPCMSFFKREVEAGDLRRDSGVGYHRRIIKIRAEDSPNVRYARAEIAKGKSPSNRVIIPGVKTWEKYQDNRKTWDPELQCIGLDANWYEGPEQKLVPSAWLALAAQRADAIGGRVRKAKGIGVDPAEGGDSTSMAAVDELGLIELVSTKTPDTSVIPSMVKAFAMKHGVGRDDAWRICFDRGGGGKQHADRMRQASRVGGLVEEHKDGLPWNVRTIAFGEALILAPKRAKRLYGERFEIMEEKGTYVNRRAQMYFSLRDLVDPNGPVRFAIPAECDELRRQLALMPLLRDGEGRGYMLPKDVLSDEARRQGKKTLKQLLGCSPDESDALVLACHAMTTKPIKSTAGAVL